ncbi:hypothetical protein BI308_02565 [Roseofilum reptotaenium AO1-A]|uniref:Uncharacterized protein n=1 Tax=Roseofilum reptotaenium AO1-A TaxID=1925591 RepID=A0A1L9QXL5_9CYAN|nr:hypothetical protein BI308_02565 [Roseofilum reptotaenium AO1-A]
MSTTRTIVEYKHYRIVIYPIGRKFSFHMYSSCSNKFCLQAKNSEARDSVKSAKNVAISLIKQFEERGIWDDKENRYFREG